MKCPQGPEEGVRTPGARIIVSCELPNTGDRNPTLIFYKSSILSYQIIYPAPCSFIFKDVFTFICMSALSTCMYVYMYVYIYVHVLCLLCAQGDVRASDSLWLELQLIVSCPRWMLGPLQEHTNFLKRIF